MSGRTFTYLSSYDDFVRQLLPDVELSQRRKSVGIGDNMLREIEEFINRFCVTATNDDGDLTFDAAGTYTFEGAIVLKGPNAAISSANFVPGSGGSQSQSGFKLDGATGTGDFASGLIVDGALTLGSGSTSAPSIGFFGDLNTGIFRPSDETIAFVTGGTQRATITSSGITADLIGNQSGGSIAATTLTASGDANFDSGTLFVDSTNNRVGVGTASPESILHLNPGTDLTPDANGVGHLMIDGNGYTSFLTMDGTATWIGNNSNGRALILATDETARLTVLGTGNVGIGTTSPASKLHIVDSGEALRMERSGYDTYGFQHSAGNGIEFRNFTDTRTELYFDGAGQLGIGNTAPETPLTIVAANRLGSTFTGTVDGEGLRVDQSNYSSGNYVSLVESSYDDGQSAPHVRIAAMFDGGGSHLAFGTSNSFGSGITNTALFIDEVGDASFSGNVSLSTSGDGYLAVSPPTGTGNDAEWAAPLGVYVLRRNSSLAAEKENITADLGEHLTADMIDSVVPKLWNRLNSPGYPEIGPIAEDMDAISPFLAARGTDADNVPFLTGINKTAYLSLLVLAVKDLRARVATLEAA